MNDEFFRSRATYLSLIDDVISGELQPQEFVGRFLKVRDADITKATLESIENPPPDAADDWNTVYSTVFYACEDVSFREDRDPDMITPEAFMVIIRGARERFSRLAALPGTRPQARLQ